MSTPKGWFYPSIKALLEGVEILSPPSNLRNLRVHDMNDLLSDKEVSDFLDAFKKGSRKVYSAGLSKFLSFYRATGRGKTISEFLDALEADVRLPRRQRKRVGEKVIREFVGQLEREKMAPKSIRTYVSAIQSLASYYGFKLTTKYVNLPSSQPVSEKHPWTLEEMGEFIMGMTHLELRSISGTMFTSGISLGDVLSVTRRDIKRELEAGTTPLCIDFSRQKTDVPFMTFIAGWAVNLLREYLETVEKKKGPDPIYTMSKRTVEGRFKKLAGEKLGDYEGYNPARPHSLRSAFRTLLGDAGQQEIYIEFFMGHRVAEHKRVYVSKSREGWRATYKKYEPALTPSKH